MTHFRSKTSLTIYDHLRGRPTRIQQICNYTLRYYSKVSLFISILFLPCSPLPVFFLCSPLLYSPHPLRLPLTPDPCHGSRIQCISGGSVGCGWVPAYPLHWMWAAECGAAQIEARMEPREGVLLLPVAQGELGCELLCWFVESLMLLMNKLCSCLSYWSM